MANDRSALAAENASGPNVSTDPGDYRHHVLETVRYDDLDTYRHVNNKVFLSYMEDARVRYYREAGGFTHQSSPVEGLVIAHSSIDYVASILYGDEVHVYTRCARIGTKSYEIHHLIEITRDGSRRTAAAARAIMVSVDPQTGASRPNTPDVVTAIRAYERTTPR